MEAPFRLPIPGLADVERLLDILAASSHVVSGSLRWSKDQEYLVEQLSSEGRLDVFLPVLTS